jgi:hypothetical protein
VRARSELCRMEPDLRIGIDQDVAAIDGARGGFQGGFFRSAVGDARLSPPGPPVRATVP